MNKIIQILFLASLVVFACACDDLLMLHRKARLLQHQCGNPQRMWRLLCMELFLSLEVPSVQTISLGRLSFRYLRRWILFRLLLLQ